MNLLQKNHLRRRPPFERIQKGIRCYEYNICKNVLCPAYGRTTEECWFILNTKCTISPTKGSYFYKISFCLSCSYFNYRAKQYIHGKNSFLSIQLQKYNFEALKKLYQKEESFIETLNRIPDGIFTTDEEFRITYFNPAAERITGFSAFDAVGMYCKDVFKNSVCETGCALKKAVALGQDILNKEYEIINIEGKKVPIICSTSAFKDKDGKIIGGLEIFKDISELKALQNEIFLREKKYRRIFEGSHDMIFISTESGKIKDINEAGVKMLGYDNKEQVLNLESADRLYLKPEFRNKFVEIINQKGQVKDYQTIFRKRNGTVIHVLISGRKYQNSATGETEYEGIIKDITQRKLMEDNLRRKNKELLLLNSIAVAMNFTMDLNYILDTTLRNLLTLIRRKDGGIFLIEKELSNFILVSAQGILKNYLNSKIEVVFKDSLLFHQMLKEENKLPPAESFPPFHVAISRVGDEKLLWLKCFLISFKGKCVGFFGLIPGPQDAVSFHDAKLMGSLGNFLGGAIENFRLMSALKAHQKELKRLTKRLFESQEEERRRIARELHDEAGQSLTAINLALEGLEKLIPEGSIALLNELYEIRRLVSRATTELKYLSYRLHPTLLHDLGLEPALRSYFKQISARCGLEIDFQMVGFDKRLDSDTETALYRFAQETLTNVLKHSGAEHFKLSIIKSYPKVIFTAEDDGCGFDVANALENSGTLGLIGMRERASFLGGTFQVKSVPGKGTKVRIEIPINGGDEDA